MNHVVGRAGIVRRLAAERLEDGDRGLAVGLRFDFLLLG